MAKRDDRDSLKRIRDRWLEGSPPDKRGVTGRYIVFGEARKWIVERLQKHLNGRVLDIGFGHGFLSYEMAVRTPATIVGIDFLGGEQLRIAKSGLRTGGLNDRVSFLVGDARKLPFSSGSFDSVISFLSFEDVNMTGGRDSLAVVIEESMRILRPGGLLAVSDNMFPECVKEESQNLYWRIQTDEFHAGLPSKEVILEILSRDGLRNTKQERFDPDITLGPEDSRIELMDVIEARPFGKTFDFEKLWQNYGKEIEEQGLSYPNVLLISGQKQLYG
jgi:ubiquinone/menaquinone biosynthesis C-methylase UbiE